MKKLIAMIGAVAMSFGLFAATSFTTSFDTGDDGVSGTEYTSADAGWTGLTDPLTLKAYDTETDPAYAYDGTDRRFAKDNLQYLPLETERTNALNHAIGEGNVFVDQLVRFTGFEDPQTNLVDGVKIAVWMGEFFNDEETAATTNLYVTVGSDYLEGQIAVKLDGTYEINKWYRLTIKSLGDIFNAGTSAPRAGFCIWIDGGKKAIASDDDHHEGLILRDTQLKDAAKAAYAKSQLFPAVSSGSDQIALNSFGYNGIGAIDDVYVDDVGPSFVTEEYTFTIAEDERVKVASVYAGNVRLEEPYKVDRGATVTITWEAKDGYKIRGDGKQDTAITSEEMEVEVDDDQVEILDVVATVTNGATVNEFAEDELYGMINNLVDGDEVEFILDAEILDDGEEQVYGFSAGTTIVVTVDENDVVTWQITSETAGDWPTDNAGADANLIKVYTFVDDDSTLMLGGDVAGEITASSIEVVAPIEVAGALTAAVLMIDDAEYVTLTGEGRVITTDGTLSEEGDYIVADEGTVEVLTDTPEEGWYTYQISAEPPPPGETFTVTVPELTTGLTIASITTNSIPVDPAVPGDYTLNEGELFTMTYAPDEGYKFTDDSEDGVREATETMTIEPPAVEAIPPTTGFMVIIAAGGTKGPFETLAAAVEAAEAGDTVQLLSDETVTGICAITKSITLDLNGKTLSKDTTEVGYKSKMIVVQNGATLTVDGTDEGSTVKGGIYAGVSATSFGTIIVNGGTYYPADGKADCAFSSNGNAQSEPGNAITINNAEVYSPNDIAIYLAGLGTYAINNSKVEGYTAIYQKAGTLAIDETSVITATGDTYIAAEPNTNGANKTGDAIVLDSNASYAGAVTLYIDEGALVTKTATGAAAIRETVTSGNESTTLSIDPGDVTDIAVTDSFAEKVAEGKAQLPGFVAVAGGKAYATLAAAVAAAQTTDTVALLADVTLTETLEITKTTTIDLAGKTITFADTLTKGINTANNSGTLTIVNGAFAVTGTRTNLAKSRAIMLNRTNGVFEDLVINVPGFEYVLDQESNLEDRYDYWDLEPAWTLVCDNVAITGNGSLFHIENAKATLDGCSATATGTSFGGAHEAAIYSSCGSIVTVNGGTFTAPNALQTGNLGGDIIVKNGVFNGNIKSWMLDNDTRDFADVNKANIQIEKGMFTGNFVYADGCSAESPLLTVVISGGDFSDKTIPVAFIKPVEHKVAKWVDSTTTGYVTPGYDWVQVKAIWVVDDVATTNLVDYNTVPVQPEDPVKTGYTFTGWQPTPGAAITEDTTYTAQFEANNITITVNYGEGIETLIINDVPRSDGEEIMLPADTKAVPYELVKDEDIKIPVFYQTNDGAVKTRITANGSLAVSDGLEVTFSAKDAASEDVTDADAKAVLKEQGFSDTTLAKFSGSGEVKKFAGWVENHPVAGDTINNSNYVQASVALDVDLITATTEIKITDLKEVTGGAMTFKVKIATSTMETEEQLNAIKGMVKATKDVTDWTTAAKQLEVTATADVETGTVTITPVGSPAAAFMRVVILTDVTPDGN